MILFCLSCACVLVSAYYIMLATRAVSVADDPNAEVWCRFKATLAMIAAWLLLALDAAARMPLR